jgi:hypothetical protein
MDNISQRCILAGYLEEYLQSTQSNTVVLFRSQFGNKVLQIIQTECTTSCLILPFKEESSPLLEDGVTVYVKDDAALYEFNRLINDFGEALTLGYPIECVVRNPDPIPVIPTVDEGLIPSSEQLMEMIQNQVFRKVGILPV